MEAKLKHLEFIQSVINRMASNSATIKGWAITLVAALFALATKDADRSFVLIAYMPLIVFWALDGYYLCRERGYRELYEEVSIKEEREINFSMKVGSCSKQHRLIDAVLSTTLTAFYLPIMIMMLIIMYLVI